MLHFATFLVIAFMILRLHAVMGDSEEKGNVNENVLRLREDEGRGEQQQEEEGHSSGLLLIKNKNAQESGGMIPINNKRKEQEVKSGSLSRGRELSSEGKEQWSWVEVASMSGEFGGDIAMSGDGKTIVLPLFSVSTSTRTANARVMREIDGNWVQIGDDISPWVYPDLARIDISDDGTRLVIGLWWYNNETGLAHAFEEIDGSWVQIGTDMNGDHDGDEFGSKVAISGDGKRIVVTAISKFVRVFEEINSQWVQIGSDLNNPRTGDYFGSAVAISRNGKRIAVGTLFHEVSHVYEEDGGTWIQVGDDNTSASNNFRGHFDIAITGDGKRVAVDNLYDANSNSSYSGIFGDNDGTWIPEGSIQELEDDEYRGRTLAMSDSGQTLARGGCCINEGVGREGIGWLRAFNTTNGTSWTQIGNKMKIENLGVQRAVLSSDGMRLVVGSWVNFEDCENGFSACSTVRIFDLRLNQSAPPSPTAQTSYPTLSPTSLTRPSANPSSTPANSAPANSSPSSDASTNGKQSPTSVNSPSQTPSQIQNIFIFGGASVLFVVVGAIMYYFWKKKPSKVSSSAILNAEIVDESMKEKGGANQDLPWSDDAIITDFGNHTTIMNPSQTPSNDEEHRENNGVIVNKVDGVGKSSWLGTLFGSEKEETKHSYNVFLTHNWGNDTHNRDNHQRVIQFKNELERCGIDQIWLDEDRMTGNIIEQMCNGIDQSRFVIVFVTQRYIDKVHGKGRKGANDNCKLEFEYATRKKEKNNFIAVVMEDNCLDSNHWGGPVGMHLGGNLYIPFTVDSEVRTSAMRVAAEIKKRILSNLSGDGI